MLQKPFTQVACVVLLCIPQSGLAQTAVVQQFDQALDSPKKFVLAPTQRHSILPHDLAINDGLAADFADLQRTEKPNPRQPSPRNLKRQQENPSLAPNATLPACATSPYSPNPALPPRTERRRAVWYAIMADAACDAGVPVPLFDALIIAESRYNPAALSPKGAAGLAQLMPGSARAQGVGNVWNPAENLAGGARLMRSLLGEFGRFDLALAAYNAGPGRVRATRQVPRILETERYVSGILATMRDQLLRERANLR